MQNLNQLLKILLENELDFFIIGGFAAVVHGSSHVTKDLDISMLMNDENIITLREALRNLNPRHRMNPTHRPSFLDEPKTTEGLKNIYLETDAGILDVVSLDPSFGNFEDFKQRALRVNLFGYECKVLSLDDLIEVKKTMHRPKDIIVLEELLALKNQKT